MFCETHEQAKYAAGKVVVTYEELPSIISIDEAIAAQSFLDHPRFLHSGNVDQFTDGSAAQPSSQQDLLVHVRDTVRCGQQDHFYLETHCSLAVPLEGNESDVLEVHSSTQSPANVQKKVAMLCGIPQHKVCAKNTRLGGGFGGKESKVVTALVASLGAHLLGRPAMLNLERDVDMSITGQRHAFRFDYTAGCYKNGKFAYVDIQMYSNAGESLDLSGSVMDKAMVHIDNTYSIPNIRILGRLCRTNQPSHTAFRGFGGPQAMFVIETILTHLATVSGVSVHNLRTINMYKEGDLTYYGQQLSHYNVPQMWRDIHTSSSYFERVAAIKKFNSENRWVKRGISMLPTKFGISFEAKFLSQVCCSSLFSILSSL